MPGLTPEMLAEIAAQPKEWAEMVENPRFFQKPDRLATADDAFTLLGHILWRWKAPPRYRQGGESFGERPQENLPTVDSLDRVLAAFVLEHPSALESLLAAPESQKVLAFAQREPDARARREGRIIGGLPDSLLGVLIFEARAQEAELLWRTVRAMEMLSLWRVVLTAQKRYRPFLREYRLGLAYGLLGSLLKHHGPDVIPGLTLALQGIVPLHMVDVMPVIALAEADFDYCFPEILPEDTVLCQMSAQEITKVLAQYRGMEAKELDDYLIRHRFLAEGESVGEVILRDVQTLVQLGTTRQQLADTLQTMLALTSAQGHLRPKRMKKLPLKTLTIERLRYGVNCLSYAGHHQDPFHDDDMFYLSREVGGSCDVTVRANLCRGEDIFFSDMAPYLIRRACFFEGSVPYRLDPAKACRVLAPLLKESV